ncbi:MAG: hypothetical protein ACTSUV_03370 [Candidatus Ranarchaeia archaeon]
MQLLPTEIYQSIGLQLFFLILPSIFAGVTTAWFTVTYSHQKEKKLAIKATRAIVASQITLFEASCRVLSDRSDVSEASLEVVRSLALQTAKDIMEAFKVHPEAQEQLPWGELMGFAHGLVLMSVKGPEGKNGHKWFITTAKELRDEAMNFMKLS